VASDQLFNVCCSQTDSRVDSSYQNVDQRESKSSHHDVSPQTPQRALATQTPRSSQPVAAERSASQKPERNESLRVVSLLPP